jgi:tetratricopeptide (TPR) repeat protein
MKFGISGSGDTVLRSLAVVALLAGLTLSSTPNSLAIAQEPGGRFRVLVVPMQSKALDDDFGEDVAKELRDRLEDFATHAPIAENEFKRALKRYEVKPEDLNAIRARQLANLMGAQVVFWGEVNKAGAGYEVDAKFIDVKTGDEVAVPKVTVRDDNDEAVKKVAAAAIDAFQEQVKFVRARQFCADYAGSQQPENAIRNCNEALEINPKSVDALYNKGLAFRQLYENEQQQGTNGWADSAITYFERVLENDPGRRIAMQQAAWLYSKMGEANKATELYKQYLELDPGNVPVRLKVAYDLANADLMPEAIEIIQGGLEYAENDTTLLQSLGDYALQYSSEDSSYVDIALDAYKKVLELKGAQTDVALIENAIAAYTRADKPQEAVQFAEQALESHSDSPRLWSLYADALGRMERYSEAAAAMDSVIALDESYQHAYLKRGRFKLQAGNEDAALADFQKAIQVGSSTESDVFTLLWAEAIQNRNNGNYTKALPFFEKAAEYAPADKRQELQFWWGYTNYQLGEQLANPQDAGINQLQRAQSQFQASLQHLNQAGQVKKEIPQLKDAAQKWLLNIEARIKQLSRGG